MQHILVVEDDPQVREVVCEILGAAGFETSSAQDGVAALEELGRRAFDLVLLDIRMPRMNGLELLDRLQEVPSPPRAVMMTGDDDPATVLDAARGRAYRYITKPVAPKALVEVVREALEAEAPPAPIEIVSASSHWIELLVPCTLEAAERIYAFLGAMRSDLPADARDSVGKAFRELLMNAVEWGGRLDPARKVRIACLRTARMVMYRIADPGAGFRFESLPHSALANPPGKPAEHERLREEKGMRPGGFGLLMARAMVDEMVYNEKQNEVVLVKYLERETGNENEEPGTRSFR
ncbi:MAG TPA: response regulator [Terriglobia bacterium]|nr:response regulator [Terriglobia bacterium]